MQVSLPKTILSLVLIIGLAISSFAQAQALPHTERQKIEALITRIGELKDAKFVRNGSIYEVPTAVRFLRGKWEANDSQVKTARDFIDKVAKRRPKSMQRLNEYWFGHYNASPERYENHRYYVSPNIMWRRGRKSLVVRLCRPQRAT